MIYKLKFLPSALKEWHKLDATIQSQLKKKLQERMKTPKIPASRLAGFDNCYKIKLHHIGYRLVYEVVDAELCVLVIAIGKRNRNQIYKIAKSRV